RKWSALERRGSASGAETRPRGGEHGVQLVDEALLLGGGARPSSIEPKRLRVRDVEASSKANARSAGVSLAIEHTIDGSQVELELLLEQERSPTPHHDAAGSFVDPNLVLFARQ